MTVTTLPTSSLYACLLLRLMKLDFFRHPAFLNELNSGCCNSLSASTAGSDETGITMPHGNMDPDPTAVYCY